MDKLSLPHAKLFYFSAELYKANKITENEKLKLKEMVINDEPDIFEILEKYQKTGCEQTLTNNLLALLRPHEKHLYQQPVKQQQQQTNQSAQNAAQQAKIDSIIEGNNTNGSPMQQPKNTSDIDYSDDQYLQGNQKTAEWISQNPNVPDEISSPLGLQLLKRKKRQKKKGNVGDHLKPFKAEDV